MKRKRTKLTPSTIARIQSRRRAGGSYAALAAEFRCSAGSIRNALREAPSATTAMTAPSPTTPAIVDGGPMGRDELVAFLSAQARTLMAEIESSTDATARAAANRSLVAVQTLIQRTLPPQPLDPQVGTFVDAASMNELGAQVRERLTKAIGFLTAQDGPTCPSCHRPLARFAHQEMHP